MKVTFKELYNIISEADKRVFYIGKKSTFMFCFITVLAQIFPTEHNGDIVDIIWSNLYWAGPCLALSSCILLFLAAYQELKTQGKAIKDDKSSLF